MAVVVAAVLAGACGGDDADDDENAAAGAVTTAPVPAVSPPSAPATSADDGAATTTPPDGGPLQPEGFERVQATITLAEGTPCELCLWLADDADRRSRGLMHVTDLGAADGMVFTFDGPTTAQFWMGNTPLPLSIAFFDADGAFVSTVDMEPCLAADEDCPRYAAAAPYVTSIELPLGEVARLGIGPGSVLALSDLPCG